MLALIIDNEKQICDDLKNQIKSNCPQIRDVFIENNIPSAIKTIKSVNPDIVFLDVELNDGTGMDLLNKLGYFEFQLIFITAHDKYALEAFKFSAIDFLLKPIDPEDLIKSVLKAEDGIKYKNMFKQFEVLKESIDSIKSGDRKIVLGDNANMHFIKVSDIINCKAEGAYTEFYLNGGEKLFISNKLKDYEELLGQYDFIRTHHGHLVNMNKVLKFDKVRDFLLLENKQEVPVSQRKREQVMTFFSKK